MSYDLPAPGICSLPHLGTILVGGEDARAYLQGQVSFDVMRLTPDRMELACLSSPQGRVQAVLWMIERPEGLVLILPADLIETTMARLRKYTLRARVSIVAGSFSAGGSFDATATNERLHTMREAVSSIDWPDSSRRLTLLPAGVELPRSEAFETQWHLADIRAGLPQVFRATHEAFVAQMLNIDLLGGISFEKGCYTGQEIIARAHYRGSVKRRMFAFRAECPPPRPGSRIAVGDSHAGDVVSSAPAPQGCELLAVVSLAELGKELRVAESPGAVLAPLPMPYEVPLPP